MSKKTEKFDFDEDAFNFDDFGDGGFNSKSKKTGARRVITDFGGGLVTGLKNSFLNPTNQRNFLEKNLPKGFVATFDAGSAIHGGAKSIYETTQDEVSKQLGEMAPDLKKLNDEFGKKYAPKTAARVGTYIDGVMPRENNYEKEAEDEDRKAFSEETLAALAAEVGRSAHRQTHIQTAVTNASTDKITTVGTANLSALLSANKLLTNISNNTDRTMQYKLKVDAVMQRKAMELSYRQYTIQRQHLDVSQQMLALQKEAFEALVKNTGLPEAIKSTNWELASRSIKQKLIGQATERFSSSFASTGQRILDTIRTNAKNNVGMMGSQLSMALSMGAMGADMASSGMMGSKSSMAGEAAGSGLFWLMQHFFHRKYGDKIKANKTVNKYSNIASNFMDSFPGKFNDLQNNGGMFSRIMNMLGVGDIFAEDSSRQRRVRGSGFSAFDELQSWNKQSQLALTEVIPGYLRMIQHDLAIMRSGNANISDQRYNWDKGTFESSTNMKESLRKGFYDKNSLKGTRTEALKVVQALDSKGQLSPKARHALMRYVIQQGSSDIGSIDPRKLMTDVSPIYGIDPKAADEIRTVLGNEHNFNYTGSGEYNEFSDKDILFGNSINDGNYQSRMAEANKRLKDLRYAIPINRNSTLKHASVGNQDLLKDLGVLKWNADAKQWDYDESAFVNAVMGKGIPKAGGMPNTPFGGAPFQGVGGAGGNGGGATPPPLRDDPFGNQSEMEYTPFQLDLLDAIQTNSAKDAVLVSNELLEAIRQRLEAGIPQGEASSTQENKQRTSWFRKAMNGAGWVKSKLGAYAKFGAWTAPKAMFDMGRNAVGGIWNSVLNSPRFKKLSDLKGAASERLGDLYIKGREGVIITLADLQAGKYYDEASRKVIKSFADIKGAIVDADGNVIISAEDVKSKLYTMVKGKPFSIVGGMLRAGLSLATGLLGLNKAGFLAQARFMKRTVQGAWNFGKRLLSQADDVYVVGETTPRLLANLMRNGAYHNRDGSLVKTPHDIKGDVLDALGNVLLSTADISKGIVNKSGKPFKTVTDRIIGLLKLPLTLGRKAWDLAKKPFHWAKRLFEWGSGKVKPLKGKESASEVQFHIASTVDKIHDLLSRRLPKNPNSWNSHNGHGWRDGSRADFMSRMRDRVKDRQAQHGETKKRSGLFGMLSMILGGLGTIAGTVKGWASNIFAGMRSMAEMRAGAGVLGSLAGGGSGKKGLLRRFGGWLLKSKLGKFALGAGALYGLSRTSMASDVFAGARDGFNGSANNAQDEAQQSAQMLSGGSDGGGSGGGVHKEGQHQSFRERLKNAMGGSVLGELGAVASAPLLYMGMNKVFKRWGGKFTHETPKLAANASTKEKLLHFLTKTGKGRMVLAAITGGALYTGKDALWDQGDNTLHGSAAGSYATSMGLDAAMLAAPWLWAKHGHRVKGLFNRGGATPHVNANPSHSYTMGGTKTNYGSTGGATHYNPYGGTPHPAGGVHPSAAALERPGLMSRAGGALKGLGKGIARHTGLLGLGIAGYDAYNQQGGLWDKTKTFGSSLAQGVLISKGLQLGGKALTQAGRAEMMAGARGLASRFGTQALLQGGRTALMAGGEALMGGATALGGIISAPVVLGAAAVAAIGIGAWLGYKYFFKKDQNAVARFRMAQYGFDLDDKAHTTMVGQLEALCQKSVTFTPQGKAQLSRSVNVQSIVKLFNLPMDDRYRVQAFGTWFQSRFKPVFLNALAAYKGMTKSTDLEKADTLKKEQKIALVNQMNNVPANPDPYAVLQSPFAGGNLKYDRPKVLSELKVALRNLSHENGTTDRSSVQKVGDALHSGWDKTKRFVGGIWDDIKDGAGRLATAAGGIGSAIGEFGRNTWDNTRSAVTNIATGNWSGLKQNVIQAGANVAQLGRDSWQSVKMMGGSTREKYNKIRDAAMKAGDPHPDVVAAQWATESSWGAHQSGKWNFFGIKAVGNQPGTVCPTHEVVNGRRIATTAKFADYRSLEDGIAARVQFIRSNPRYTKAGYYTAVTPAQAALSLVRAGYATDPGYAVNLCKIIKGCGYDPQAPSPKPKSAAQLLKDNSNMRSGLTTAAGVFGATAQIGQGNGRGARSTMSGANAQAEGYRLTASSTGTSANSYGGVNASDAAKAGAITVSGDASAFLNDLNKHGDLIALGKKITKVQSGVDINGMVKGFMICFYAMVGEAAQKGLLTSVQVNSANRSIDKQKELYSQYLTKGHPLAAKPGSSNHNFGVAIDINSANAETLARSGLLDKYHFHRPLLHHPTHPEPWHLENTLFAKRGKNTQKEVAKAVKDKGSSAKVEKAHQDLGKDTPVVKAERTTTPAKVPPSIHQQITPTGGATAPSVTTPQTDESIRRRPSDILNQSTTSTGAVNADGQSQSKAQMQQDADHATLLQKQLDIQTQTLQVLSDIHNTLKGSGKTGGVGNSQTQSNATDSQISGASQAADVMRGRMKDVPVAMGFNRR